MTTLLTCAVCGRDWSRGPDDSGDPMASWITADTDKPKPEVCEFALVCNACSCVWERSRRPGLLYDAHLSWMVGPARALKQLARVLEAFRWPPELSRQLAQFAVEASKLPSPNRRRAK